MSNFDLFSSNDVNQDDEILEGLIKSGAIFYASVSGGKDGSAMYAVMKKRIPMDQIAVVHANLGSVEHGEEGDLEDFIRSNIEHPLKVVKANKTFMGMVERRGMWPSAKFRQCTSDLKTGPINKFIRQDLAQRGKTIGVNCMGLRAEESTNRAKCQPLTINNALTLKTGARTVYDWLPVFDMSAAEVFETIVADGQEPHPAYGYNPESGQTEGNERLSCVLCIMGSANDLRNGAAKYPEKYAQYVATEKVLGHTMFAKSRTVNKVKTVVPVPLEEKTGIKADPSLVAELIPAIQLRVDEYQREKAA